MTNFVEIAYFKYQSALGYLEQLSTELYVLQIHPET